MLLMESKCSYPERLFTAKLSGSFLTEDNKKFEDVHNAVDDKYIDAIVIDMEEVKFLDSAAFGNLLMLFAKSQEKEKNVFITGVSMDLKDALEKMEFSKLPS